MNFFNRHVILFAVIAFVASCVFTLLLHHFIHTGHHYSIVLLSICYGLFMFFSALLIGKRDIYEGHIGFNYHLVTYLACNAAPFVLILIHRAGTHYIHQHLSILFFWGIGLCIHMMVFFTSRKRSIRGIDRDEVFK